jgi:hypothetical protein
LERPSERRGGAGVEQWTLKLEVDEEEVVVVEEERENRNGQM